MILKQITLGFSLVSLLWIHVTAQTCTTSQVWPYQLKSAGTATGVTQIDAVAYSSVGSGSVAFSGRISDTSINATPRAILGVIDPTTAATTWIADGQTDCTILSLTFNDAATYIYVVFTKPGTGAGNPVDLAVMRYLAATGVKDGNGRSLTTNLMDTQIKKQALVIQDPNVFIATYGVATSRFGVFKFDWSLSENSNSNVPIQKRWTTGGAYVMKKDQASTNMFVGGDIEVVAAAGKRAVLVGFNNMLVMQWRYAMDTSTDYSVTNIQQKSDVANKVYLGMTKKSAFGIVLARVTLDASKPFSPAGSEIQVIDLNGVLGITLTAGGQDIQAMYVASADQVYSFVRTPIYDSTFTHGQGALLITDFSTSKTTFKPEFMVFPESSAFTNNDISAAVFTGAGTGFYVGRAKNFYSHNAGLCGASGVYSSLNTAYSFSVGFVQNISKESSCITDDSTQEREFDSTGSGIAFSIITLNDMATESATPKKANLSNQVALAKTLISNTKTWCVSYLVPTITATAQNNYSWDSTAALSLMISAFTLSQTCSDFSFVYTLNSVSCSGTCTNANPFTISGTNIVALANVAVTSDIYTVTIKGTLSNGDCGTTASFTITAQSAVTCSSDTVSVNTAITDRTHIIYSTDNETPSFSHTVSGCATTYALVEGTTGTYDSSVITFSTTTGAITIHATSTSLDTVVWTIKVTATSTVSSSSATDEFTVTFTNPCKTAVLTWTAADFVDLTFAIGGSASSRTIGEFKDSVSLAYGDGSGTDLCGARTYSITEGDASTPVNVDYLTLSTRLLTLDTVNTDRVGSHEIWFNCVLASYSSITQTVTFKAIVTEVLSCVASIATVPTVVSPQTYVLGAAAKPISFAGYTIVDPNACGYALSYTANVIAADGSSSAITNPPFTLSGTTVTVQALVTATQYVDSYTINIVASLTDGTTDSSLQFIVFIYPSGLACANDQVDNLTPLPNYIYSLGITGDLTITPTFTHKNVADNSCPWEYTYTSSRSDVVVSFDKDSGVLILNQQAIDGLDGVVATFTIQALSIVSNQNNPKDRKSNTFTVTFQDTCSAIMAAAVAPYFADASATAYLDKALTLEFTELVESSNGACGTATYTFVDSADQVVGVASISGTTITVTFTDSDLITTSPNSYYIAANIGSYFTAPGLKSTAIEISVEDCATVLANAVAPAFALTTQTAYLNVELSLTFDYMTETSGGICGTTTYTFLDSADQEVGVATISGTTITMTFTDSDLIASSPNLYYVVANVDSDFSAPGLKSAAISIDILEVNCVDIMAAAIAPEFTLASADAYINIPLELGFDSLQEDSAGACGTVTYTLLDSSDQVVGEATVSGNTVTLLLTTDNLALVDTSFDMRIIANVDDYFSSPGLSSAAITISVFKPACDSTSLTVSELSDMTFDLYERISSQQLVSYVYSNPECGTPVVSITTLSRQPVSSLGLTLSWSSNKLLLSSASIVGAYRAYLTVTVPANDLLDTQVSIDVLISVLVTDNQPEQVVVEEVVASDNTAPYFEDEPEDLTYQEGEAFSFKLGLAFDDEDNNFFSHVKYSDEDENLVLSILDYYPTQDLKYMFRTRTALPAPGEYTITVTLTETSGNKPLSTEYNFTLTIVAKEVVTATVGTVIQKDSTSSSDSSVEEAPIIYEFTETAAQLQAELENREPKPFIQHVYFDGLVRVGFSKELVVPVDWKTIIVQFPNQAESNPKRLLQIKDPTTASTTPTKTSNATISVQNTTVVNATEASVATENDTQLQPNATFSVNITTAEKPQDKAIILELAIDPGQGQMLQYLNFTWEIVDFQPTYADFQLYYEFPPYVSTGFTSDNLIVIFWGGEKFVDKQGLHVKNGSSLTAVVNRQIEKKQAEILDSVQYWSLLAIFIVFMLAVLILLIFHAKLIFLYTMVETLQILSHLQIINVSMPGNAKHFLVNLLNMMRLNPIWVPYKTWVESLVPVFRTLTTMPTQSPWVQKVHGPYTQQFGDSFYEDHYFYHNCGQILVLFIPAIALSLLVLVIARLSKPCIARRGKGHKFLQLVIYLGNFNSLIRFVMLSFLELFLCACLNLVANNAKSSDESTDHLHKVQTALSALTVTLLATFTLLLIIFALWKIFLLSRKRHSEIVILDVRVKTLWLATKYVSSNLPLLMPGLFMLRRILFVLLLVFWINRPILQILSVMFLSTCMMMYYAHVNPYEDTYISKLQAFNEVAIFVACLHLLCFSNWEWYDDKDTLLIKNNIGWSLVAVVILVVAVNLFFLLECVFNTFLVKCCVAKKQRHNLDLHGIDSDCCYEDIQIRSKFDEEKVIKNFLMSKNQNESNISLLGHDSLFRLKKHQYTQKISSGDMRSLKSMLQRRGSIDPDKIRWNVSTTSTELNESWRLIKRFIQTRKKFKQPKGVRFAKKPNPTVLQPQEMVTVEKAPLYHQTWSQAIEMPMQKKFREVRRTAATSAKTPSEIIKIVPIVSQETVLVTAPLVLDTEKPKVQKMESILDLNETRCLPAAEYLVYFKEAPISSVKSPEKKPVGKPLMANDSAQSQLFTGLKPNVKNAGSRNVSPIKQASLESKSAVSTRSLRKDPSLQEITGKPDALQKKPLKKEVFKPTVSIVEKKDPEKPAISVAAIAPVSEYFVYIKTCEYPTVTKGWSLTSLFKKSSSQPVTVSDTMTVAKPMTARGINASYEAQQSVHQAVGAGQQDLNETAADNENQSRNKATNQNTRDFDYGSTPVAKKEKLFSKEEIFLQDQILKESEALRVAKCLPEFGLIRSIYECERNSTVIREPAGGLKKLNSLSGRRTIIQKQPSGLSALQSPVAPAKVLQSPYQQELKLPQRQHGSHWPEIPQHAQNVRKPLDKKISKLKQSPNFVQLNDASSDGDKSQLEPMYPEFAGPRETSREPRFARSPMGNKPVHRNLSQESFDDEFYKQVQERFQKPLHSKHQSIEMLPTPRDSLLEGKLKTPFEVLLNQSVANVYQTRAKHAAETHSDPEPYETEDGLGRRSHAPQNFSTHFQLECPKCYRICQNGSNFCSKCVYQFRYVCPECQSFVQFTDQACRVCQVQPIEPFETSAKRIRVKKRTTMEPHPKKDDEAQLILQSLSQGRLPRFAVEDDRVVKKPSNWRYQSVGPKVESTHESQNVDNLTQLQGGLPEFAM